MEGAGEGAAVFLVVAITGVDAVAVLLAALDVFALPVLEVPFDGALELLVFFALEVWSGGLEALVFRFLFLSEQAAPI